MKTTIIKHPSEEDWKLAKSSALKTVWKQSDKPVPDEWKYKILITEHTPIRMLWYVWDWDGVKSWISNQIRTHHEGVFNPQDVESFISTQRNDRQDKYDRNKAPQDAPVDYRVTANAQAIMAISQKRLCNCADPETKMVWESFLEKLEEVEPILYDLCVPTCIYRGGLCPEAFGSCGFNKTKSFEKWIGEYKYTLENYKRRGV